MKASEQHYEEIQNLFDMKRQLKHMYIFGSNSGSIVMIDDDLNSFLETNEENQKCVH